MGWVILRKIHLLSWKPASSLVICGSERHEEVIWEIMTKHVFPLQKDIHVCYHVIK